MAKGDDALAVLISIDGTLKALLALSEKCMAAKPAAAPMPVPVLAVASASDLDSPHGDPEVKFLPRDWDGENFKGRHFSQTSAPFLDQLAASFDYFAEKNEREMARTDKGALKAPGQVRKDLADRGTNKPPVQTATNPQTGEKLELRDGKWVPAAK